MWDVLKQSLTPQAKLDWNVAFTLKKQTMKNMEPLQKEKKAQSLSQVKCYLPKEDETTINQFNKSFDFKFWLGCSELSFANQLELEVLSDSCKCPRCWYFFPKQYMNDDLCPDCSNDN